MGTEHGISTRSSPQPKVHPESIRYSEADDATKGALFPFVGVCEQGGAVFVGIQAAFPEYGLEALILFRAPHGTSLALPLSQFSAQAVFQKVIASMVRFKSSFKEVRP